VFRTLSLAVVSAGLIVGPVSAQAFDWVPESWTAVGGRDDERTDLYAACASNEHVSLTAAHVALGSIATFEDQRGLYFSLQVGF
jgi:Protein of unknown function (DUF3034)